MEVVHRRPRVLAEIDPHSEWVRGREFDTLVVDVTGWYQLRPIILAIPVSRLCSNFLENRKRTKFPILFSFHWIYGAGFTKDQLKVLVEPSGSLQVSGERAVHGGGAGRQWCQFLKRFDLPAGGVDVAAIKVQLDRACSTFRCRARRARSSTRRRRFTRAARYEEKRSAAKGWRRSILRRGGSSGR
jgi:hypothetical protein